MLNEHEILVDLQNYDFALKYKFSVFFCVKTRFGALKSPFLQKKLNMEILKNLFLILDLASN